MAISRRGGVVLFVNIVGLAGVAESGEPPKVVHHIAVCKEPGRFAGWPANHAIWA